jgi:hypothetical protein
MAGLAFSVLSTGIFLYPLISGLVKPSPSAATMVTISVGSTGLKDNEEGMSGNIPNIAVYAEDGTQIGRAYGSNKKTWAAGTTNTVQINPDPGQQGKQATYVSVQTGGNDALCISAVTVAWPDDNNPKGWLGDMGYECATAAGPFFALSVTQTGDDPEFQSRCVPSQGFGLHIVDFGRTDGAFTPDGGNTTNPVADQWNDNMDLLCKAPARMNFYTDFARDDFPVVYQPPLQYNVDGTDKDPSKVLNGGCNDDPELVVSPCKTSRKSKRIAQVTQPRRGLNRSTTLASSLVHSTSKAHSAEDLCSHPASLGPSFVSHYEGKFCDMATRIVWPLCSGIISSGCFDTDSNTLIVDHEGLNSTHIDLLNPIGGNYTHVVYW